MNLRRLVSTITASAVSLLASSHVVMAAAVEEVQQHQEVFRDYAQEALRLAREKVQAATSSGAFGQGVPIFNTWSDTTIIALVLSAVTMGMGLLYYVLKNKSQNAAMRSLPTNQYCGYLAMINNVFLWEHIEIFIQKNELIQKVLLPHVLPHSAKVNKSSFYR